MKTALLEWVREQLTQHPAIHAPSELRLTPLSGDAGFRHYFRVNTQPPLMAVYAPKTEGHSESAEYFAKLSVLLREQGVPAPQIIEVDSEHNFLLQEDFGEECLLDVLNEETVDTFYSEAMMLLLRWQQIPRSVDHHFALYDRHKLRQEMNVFAEWFVEKLLSHQLSTQEEKILDDLFLWLEDQALAQPQVLVHRDYHSRNLMYREGHPPGVIDFQDAVWGPVTYDVASLLRDCYIRWPQEKVAQWLQAYGSLAVQMDIIPEQCEAELPLWFDTIGLQRHIKVLGVFARLHLRDQKSQYLHDLPLVINYLVDVAGQYDEAHRFLAWFTQTLMPLIERQDWYQ